MAFADEIEVLRRFYEAWDNFNEVIPSFVKTS